MINNKVVRAETKTISNNEQIKESGSDYSYEKNNYLLFIEQYIGLNRYNTAQRLLDDFKKKYPDNQERKYYYLSGILNEKKGDHIKAVQDYQKAINIHPGYSQARNALGSLYLQLGRYPESEAELLKAVEINPYNPFINYNIGDLYYKTAKLDSAKIFLSKAIKYKANYNEAYFKLGLVYFYTEKFDKALDCFENSSRFKNSSHEIYYYIGMTNGSLERADAAEVNFKKALKIKKDFYKGFLELGKLYKKQKDYKNAVKHFLIAESINFYDDTVRIYLAECYSEMKRYDDAINVIGKLIKNNNDANLVELLNQIKEKKYSE